uniref:Uncharacterized protein n=1 Tax=virus sp. ctx9V1 TaxID=2828001 RepID=A0A8S5RE38_9VIRU|nr:MAG TPA: hypothetical protein [virus sp. ctx9V1]
MIQHLFKEAYRVLVYIYELLSCDTIKVILSCILQELVYRTICYISVLVHITNSIYNVVDKCTNSVIIRLSLHFLHSLE